MAISGEQKITVPQKVTENYQQLSLLQSNRSDKLVQVK